MWTPDLMPTLLALLDIPSPHTVHGEPQPWIVDGQGQGREYVISGHHAHDHWRVTDGLWSYVACERPELYDLRADPGEQCNVISQHPAEGRRLQAFIDAFNARAMDLAPPDEG